MTRMLAIALFSLHACVSTVAFAQSAESTRPYDDELRRLSEVLGAVHYLREVCGANEGMVWRDRMEALIKSEGTTPRRRVDLTKNFNKGYRSYRRTYRTCTASAKIAISRFITEGAAISEKLVTEYGAKKKSSEKQTN